MRTMSNHMTASQEAALSNWTLPTCAYQMRRGTAELLSTVPEAKVTPLLGGQHSSSKGRAAL